MREISRVAGLVGLAGSGGIGMEVGRVCPMGWLTIFYLCALATLSPST